MPVAAGSQRQWSHVKEVTTGTDPGTAYTVDRWLAGARISAPPEDVTSDEMRADRSRAPGVNGVRHVSGTFPFELSYGTFDDFIESAMCAAWVAAGSANSGISGTVVAGTTNTLAGTGIGTNISAGDWVKVAGFVAPYTANNGFFRATAASANLLTFAEAVDALSASRLAAASAQTGISTQKMANVTPGTTEKSISIELADSGVSSFYRGRGCEVSKFSLSMQNSAKITGQFDVVGFVLDGPAATKYRTGTDTAASTTSPITSYSAQSFLFIDGVPVAIATALDFTLDNGMEDLIGLMQTTVYDILLGRSDLTGNVTFGFTGTTYDAKVLANTHVAIRTQIIDATGTQGYAIDIPNVRLKAPSEDVTENKIFHTYPWAAEKDSTSGVLNMKIWRLV